MGQVVQKTCWTPRMVRWECRELQRSPKLPCVPDRTRLLRIQSYLIINAVAVSDGPFRELSIFSSPSHTRTYSDLFIEHQHSLGAKGRR